MGWVSPAGFALRKRIRYGNGLQTEASAKFVVAPDGTRMIVRLGPRRWVVVSLAICLVWIALAVAGLALACYFLTGARCGGPPAMSFALPFLFAGILVFARWLARDDAEFLIAVLKQTLQAEEVSESAFSAPAR